MNVLIACEESQEVCKAFRSKGHNAYSCDIQEPSGGHPEWHILGDAVKVLEGGEIVTMDGETRNIPKWDLLIAHPPCTYLSNVGAVFYSLRHYPAEAVVERMQRREEAIVFFLRFALAPVDKICVENPLGRMNRVYRKADQIIHPYYFAKDANDAENYEKKRTCLWLKNLPQLVYNAPPPPPPSAYRSDGSAYYWEGKVSGADKAKIRSKTFPGVAQAMADQWG